MKGTTVKRNRIARILGSAAIISGVLVGTAACSVDGAWQLPDRENIPTLTIPTRPPVTNPDEPGTDPGDGGGNEAEVPPPAEPETPPAAEPGPDVVPPEEAPASEDRRFPWWPVLIVIVAGVVVVIVVRTRGRAARVWEEQFGVASTGVAWTESSLVPQVLAAATAADASAVWSAARPRVLEIDEQLHALLAEDAADLNRLRAIELRESFTALVSAVDAETSTSAKATADRLRELRVAVDAARARVRAALLTTSSSQ